MLEKRARPAPTSIPDASSLRIGIVHARWNKECIDALVSGCVSNLTKSGVKEENIIIESVPGSWELPIATSRFISASQVQESSSGSTDLMGGLTDLASNLTTKDGAGSSNTASKKAFDAVISIGVLIKGSTMHFEYISESCCHGLMRVGLDTGVPVILGVLTALTEEQALERCGLGNSAKKHNHGEDWASAAVEMASKTSAWSKGHLEA
ncbi:putative RIB4-6,7-dimethyl-8-ribityllumazine synthase [Meira miltonrushii]|uniref:6,7-dimethyl-8-ribityllumazine synthase n=1 Tax=Meira miltonrushii TaxID=1280837 RepID=A0A316VL89_9BASI|nr:putative RIB4-6,7-dimethyl-8-ribityllumazine synthase [Meira miltonrushii]PWN37133.1 putative RIB4-6,7-dimethyl-8-ribityllumazine synthase [Meira miltonrushii]